MADFASRRTLIILPFLAGSLLTLIYRPFAQLESGDQSIWDYMAQAILRGQIPYRDVIEIKTPLSAYLSAVAVALLKPLGLNDVIAIRLLFVLLVGAIAALTFYVAISFLHNRLAAILAVLTMLMSDRFISWMISGTEPKLWMVCFGLLTIMMIARDRPLYAGIFSIVSFLCWQPGLLFTGTAALIFTNYLTRWRDGRFLKLIAGAVIPLLITLIYFLINGAFDDLWQWTIVYNYNIYAPLTHKADSVGHVGAIFIRVFRYSLILPIVSLIGMIWFLIERIKVRFDFHYPNFDHKRSLDALWIAPTVYLLFCFINLQAGPDLIPLFPFIGLFAGYGFAQISRLIDRKYSTGKGIREEGLMKLAILLLTIITLWNGVYYWRERGATLIEQIESLNLLKNELGETDTIFAHGATEVLVLLNRPNVNPYLFLDFGKDDFIAAKMGGFDEFMKKLESERPKIVILGRLRKVEHREDLRNWAETYYNKLAILGYDEAYIRKPN
jgi:hypothetical protein